MWLTGNNALYLLCCYPTVLNLNFTTYILITHYGNFLPPVDNDTGQRHWEGESLRTSDYPCVSCLCHGRFQCPKLIKPWNLIKNIINDKLCLWISFIMLPFPPGSTHTGWLLKYLETMISTIYFPSLWWKLCSQWHNSKLLWNACSKRLNIMCGGQQMHFW